MNGVLVGSDIELVGTLIPPDETPSELLWQEWVTELNALPPKGVRHDMGDGFWAHSDGLAAEYGFEPTNSFDEFMHRLDDGAARLEDIVGDLYAPETMDVSAIINSDWAEPLLEIGCAPDMTIWDRGHGDRPHVRNVPIGVLKGNTRELGGHVHIALPPNVRRSRDLTCLFIRELNDEVFPIANPSGIPHGWYRQPMVFRVKEYGIEYRSLGADALFGDDRHDILATVFDVTNTWWRVYG